MVSEDMAREAAKIEQIPIHEKAIIAASDIFSQWPEFFIKPSFIKNDLKQA